MDSLAPTLLSPFVLVSVRPERSEAESKDPLMPPVPMVRGFLEK